jgi:hypothetical protein
LPDLDDVAVGISDVATDLLRVLLRRRQELRAPGAPFGIHRVDVGDPDIEEAADPVGIAWRLENHRGLVIGGASAGVDDDEVVGECDIGRLRAEDHRAAEYLGIKAPGATDVIGDDEVANRASSVQNEKLRCSPVHSEIVPDWKYGLDGAEAAVTPPIPMKS